MMSNEEADVVVVELDAAATAAVQSKGGKRIQWAPIEVESVEEGEKKISYPFLEDTNVKDLLVVRQLLVDKPFLAGYGQVSKCWDEFASVLNKCVDEKEGALIFDPPVKSHMIKDRFDKKYMPFVKAQQAAQPFRSGCDDQPPPGEIQQGLELIFEQYDGNRKMAGGARDKAAMDRKKGNAMGEALRRKALGGFVPKPPDGHDDALFVMSLGYGNEGDEENDAPSMSRKGKKSSKKSTSGTASTMRYPAGRFDTICASLKERAALKTEKEAIKKRKLDLEEKKFLEEQKEREENRVDREANRALIHLLIQKLSKNGDEDKTTRP